MRSLTSNYTKDYEITSLLFFSAIHFSTFKYFDMLIIGYLNVIVNVNLILVILKKHKNNTSAKMSFVSGSMNSVLLDHHLSLFT